MLTSRRKSLSLIYPILLLLTLPGYAAAQTAQFSYAEVPLGGGFTGVTSAAVDGSGNVFATDLGAGAVKEMPAGCASASCVRTLASGFSNINGVAVDSSGDVFVAALGSVVGPGAPPNEDGGVYEIVAVNGSIPASSPTVVTLGSGFNGPAGVAVDGKGNVYVADTYNNAIKEILSASNYATIVTLGSGFKLPYGVAVDGNGNVFVADTGNSAVKEILAVSGSIPASPTIHTLGGTYNSPSGVAVDGNGDVFVADLGLTSDSTIYEIEAVGGSIPATSPTVVTVVVGCYSNFALDGAGNVYFNSANGLVELEMGSVNFGTVPIGQASAAISLVFTFNSAETLGSSAALTLGAAGLDFAVANSGTCTPGSTFSAGDTCTLNVTFTPGFAGLRSGAAILENGTGNTLATGYLNGIGSGPQVSFLPYSQSVLGGGFGLPNSVAVDGSGNVFVADYTNNVKEIPAGCTSAGCVKIVGSGFNQAAGVAVDGAGNVFVADTYNNAVKEILAAGGYTTVKTLATGLSYPAVVAVDGSGNVFVADQGDPLITDHSLDQVKEIVAAGGYTTVNTLGSGFVYPSGIAVDGSGNVFVANTGLNEVQEILAASGYTTIKTIGSGFHTPAGIALDGLGNVYVADTNNYALKEILAEGGYVTVNTLVNFGSFEANGVAVDGSGNIYLPIPGTGLGVEKLDFADPPVITFPTTTTVGNTDSVDGTNTVTFENIGNAPLDITGFAPPVANFTIGGAATTCAGSSTLAAGDSCAVAIEFSPTTAGSVTGTVTWTDNALNVTGATQRVTLLGTSETAKAPPAPSITSGPANPTGAVTATFDFTDTQAGVLFVCNLDGAAYTSCNSGITYSALSSGAQTFAVKAEDSLGNQSPVTNFNWTTSAVPTPIITSAPANPTTAINAAFGFSDAQAGVSFICSLDGAAFASCTSGVSYTSLASGSHAFEVKAKDSSGNATDPATYNWTIGATLSFQSGMSEDFGTVPVGQTSAAVTLTYNFASSTTLGSPVALTEGAMGLDFAIASSGTCVSGQSFVSGNTCTVSVTFAPKFAGKRNGAVLLKDNSGNILAMVYVHGSGSAPEMIFLDGYYDNPTSQTELGGGFNQPSGIALDGSGNVYVADLENNAVKKIPTGCTNASCVVTLGGGFTGPRGVAVDGAGNVFVADWGNGAIEQVPAGCLTADCVVTIGDRYNGFNAPYGVAVDGSGNVFVADLGNNSVKEIVAAGGYVTVNTLGSGFSQPEGVAVDGSGNVFVVETGFTSATACTTAACVSDTVALMEIPAAGGYKTVKTLHSDFNAPIFVAADGAGNIYISEFLSSVGAVQEFFAAEGYAKGIDLYGSCSHITYCDRSGVAVDPSGNIYVAQVDEGINTVTKMDFADPPALTFPTATFAGAVDYTDAANWVTVLNNGNAPLDFSAITPSANFGIFNPNVLCTTTSPLGAGEFCNIGAYFVPTTSGPITGSITITDDNLNATGATQQLDLSGTGLVPAPTFLTGPPSSTSATTAAFTFTDSESTVTYLCSLDSASYSTCSSGVSYSSLSIAAHNLAIEAKDALGNVSPATSYPWTVTASTVATTPPPTPVITSGPPYISTSTTATITFTDSEAGVTFLCSLNNAAYTACNGGSVTYTALAYGNYTFYVFAEDSAGNLNINAAVLNFAVEAALPAPPSTAGVFGTFAVGKTTAPLTLTVTASASGTVSSVAALTQGAPGLDFALSAGGTCKAGLILAAGSTCTVNATFTPRAPGPRSGAVVLYDGATPANVLATVYVSGIGTGPAIAFDPGIITTIAGGGTGCAAQTDSLGDGCLAIDATLGNVRGEAVDSAGNVYIADEFNARVRKVTAATGIITTIAGTGTDGFSGDGGPAASAQVWAPIGVAVDGAGNVFIADTSNHRIRRIDASTGIITTVAGTGTAGPSGDFGPATSAELDYPFEVKVDGLGDLFIADTGNDRIREVISGSGIITTVAGNGFGVFDPFVGGQTFTGSYGGDGGLATSALLNAPSSVAFDSAGNLYIADEQNERVREVDATTGIISTVAGTGYSNTTVGCGGYNGDNIPATTAQLSCPYGVAVDAADNLYIADYYNAIIRKVDPATGIITTVAGNRVKIGGGWGGFSGDGGSATSAEMANPDSVVVDGQGNLLIGDYANGRIRKVTVTNPPPYLFATTATGSTSGVQDAVIANVGNAPLEFTSIAASANFSLAGSGGGSETSCSASGESLASASSCAVGIEFVPLAPGALTGDVTLIDNALNATAAKQLISLSGTATGLAAKTTPSVTVTPASASITTVQALAVAVVLSGGSGNPTPTGLVTLTSGGSTIASATLTGGIATINIPAGELPTGTDTLSASYVPDSASSLTYNSAAGSNAVSVTGPAKTTPTVTVTPNSASITTAQPLSITVSVAGGVGNPTPAGAVALSSGSYTSAETPLTGGTATIAIPAGTLATGTDTLTVVYAPDTSSSSTYNGATGANTVTVNPAGSGGPITASPANVNFGMVNVGSTSTAVSVTFSFPASVTLSKLAALTQGVANLDFAIQTSGTTCSAGNQTAGSSCTVMATFSPLYPGPRDGALVLYDNSSPAQAVATVFLTGIGQGPQFAILPGVMTTVAGDGTAASNGDGGQATSASLVPTYMALDGAGGIFVQDYGSTAPLIRHIDGTSGVISTIAGGGSGCANQTDSLGDGCKATQASFYANSFSGYQPIVLDGAGNLYTTDLLSDASTANGYAWIVRRIDAATGIVTNVMPTGASIPFGYLGNGASSVGDNYLRVAAADGAGILYLIQQVAGPDNSSSNVLDSEGPTLALNPQTATLTTVSSYSDPAVNCAGQLCLGGGSLDGKGDLYLTDVGGYVDEITLSTGAETAWSGPNLECGGVDTLNPILRVDAAGNGYFAGAIFTDDSQLVCQGGPKAAAAVSFAGTGGDVAFNGNNIPATQANFNTIGDIELDGQGNMYISDAGNNRIRKDTVTSGTPIVFPSTAKGATSAPIDVTIQNIGNSALSLSSIVVSPQFTLNSGGTTCAANGGLAPGTVCVLAIEFAPTTVGAVTGTVTFGDNSLNASSTQQILLSGTAAGSSATATSTTLQASAASVSSGTSVTLTATVAETSGNGVPTGTVTFYDGTNSLGTATLNASGVATLSTSSLTVGNHSLTAAYGGDTKNLSSTSTPVSLVVTAALIQTTTTITANPNPVAPGGLVTYTATVTPASGTGVPTGSVTFKYNGTANSLGSQTLNSQGQASLVYAFQTAPDTVTAVYSGDSNYAGSTSAPVTLNFTSSALATGNFGTIPVGQTSPALTLTFTSSGSGSIGSVTPMMQGAPAMDFAIISGGTCIAGASFSAGSTCTANVTFSPVLPGLRYGAVIVKDGAGNTVATDPVSGIGSGPQVRLVPRFGRVNPPWPAVGGSGFVSSGAVDGLGDVFYLQGSQQATVSVMEIPAGCALTACVKALAPNATIPGEPYSLALDFSGNLFVTAGTGTVGQNGAIWELTAAGGYQSATKLPVTFGAGDLTGIALDQSGNIFVAISSSASLQSPANGLYEVSATGGYSTATPIASAMPNPYSLAIDMSGNLLVSGAANNEGGVYEVLATGGYSTVNLLGNGFSFPGLGSSTLPPIVTVDQNGDVFFIDEATFDSIDEILASGGYQAVDSIPSAYSGDSIYPDANGNFYLFEGDSINKLEFNDAYINYGVPTPKGTTDTGDAPHWVTVQNTGNAPLNLTGIKPPSADFVIDPSTTTCSISTPVAAGGSCVVGMDFVPSAVGALTGTLTLTDNTLNVTGATQAVYLSGTGTGTTTPTVTVTPSAASITTKQALTVTVAVGGGSGNPTPTGSVILTSGSYTSAAATLSGGTATINIAAGSLATGADTLTVSYTPDSASSSTYNSATGSNTVTVTTPAKITPTVTVTPSAASITTTQALTATVSVGGGSGNPTPSGSVTLSSGSYTSAAATLSNGGAAINITAGSLATGTDTLSVAYTPDSASSSTYNSATGSNTVTVTAATILATVGTTPSGLSFSVDGTSYISAQTLTWTVGSSHTIATTSPQTSGGTQNAFASWSDGGALSHSVIAPLAATSYTASFTTSYQLTTAANPSADGSVSPASGTYYASGSVVNLTATPNSGFVFSNWTGSVSSASSASTTVTMSSPQSVTANFAAAPAPVASLTPTSLTFNAISGTTSSAQTATLINTGNAALAITGITLAGTNPSDFAQTNNCGSSLAAGANCAISVTFSPASVASFSATLSVADNAAGSPQTTTLSGTGAAPPSFTVSSSTAAQTVQPGGIAQYSITVAAQNGTFSSPVALAVSGLPTGASGAFSPASVTPGSTSATSQLSIQTASTATAGLRSAWPLALSILPLFGLLLATRRVRRRWITFMVLLIASLGTLTALSGCGGGFALPGGTAKTYTVTITGTSGAVQQTTTVQLTVQ